MGLLRRKAHSNLVSIAGNWSREEIGPTTEATSRTLDFSLEIAVRSALQCANADGAAIALMQGGMLLCRARAGTLAPDIGMRLDVNAGITGACVRNAEMLICNDAENDSRVDCNVCRALGIRSVLVLPIINKGGVIGVVEILSAKDHAFDAEHIRWLTKLAVWIRDFSCTERNNVEPASNSLSKHEPTIQEPADSTTLDAVPTQEQGHRPEVALGTFLSVLQKSSPAASWDELCHELSSRLDVKEKDFE